MRRGRVKIIVSTSDYDNDSPEDERTGSLSTYCISHSADTSRQAAVKAADVISSDESTASTTAGSSQISDHCREDSSAIAIADDDVFDPGELERFNKEVEEYFSNDKALHSLSKEDSIRHQFPTTDYSVPNTDCFPSTSHDGGEWDLTYSSFSSLESERLNSEVSPMPASSADNLVGSKISNDPLFIQHSDSINGAVSTAIQQSVTQLEILLNQSEPRWLEEDGMSMSDDGMHQEEANLIEAERIVRQDIEVVDRSMSPPAPPASSSRRRISFAEDTFPGCSDQSISQPAPQLQVPPTQSCHTASQFISDDCLLRGKASLRDAEELIRQKKKSFDRSMSPPAPPQFASSPRPLHCFAEDIFPGCIDQPITQPAPQLQVPPTESSHTSCESISDEAYAEELTRQTNKSFDRSMSPPAPPQLASSPRPRLSSSRSISDEDIFSGLVDQSILPPAPQLQVPPTQSCHISSQVMPNASLRDAEELMREEHKSSDRSVSPPTPPQGQFTQSSPQHRSSCEMIKQKRVRNLVSGNKEMLHLEGGNPSEALRDAKLGEFVAEMAYLLRAHFTLQQPDPYIPFDASDAVDSLIALGLAINRREATAQCSLLFTGGFLIPASPFGKQVFKDGSDLYRFADRQELRESLNRLSSKNLITHEGAEIRMLLIALQATLDMPDALDGSLSDYIILRAVVATRGESKQKAVRQVMQSIKVMIGIDQLSSCDLLRLMIWTRDFKLEGLLQHSEKDLKQQEECHAESDKLNAMLMSEYRGRIILQIQRWVTQASWERHFFFGSVELSHNSEGHVVTSDPEDMMFAIKMQMSVVQESLPQSCCIEVMIDVLLELKRAQLRMREALSESWMGLDIAWLCSVVNDSMKLLEYCESLEIFGTMQEGFIPTFELKKVSDDVTHGYFDLAVEVTEILAQYIMEDLREPVLSHILSPRWELEQDMVQIIISTFRDYFRDLSLWLPNYEFSLVVKKCISRLLEEYMRGAFAQDESVSFLNVEAVSGHLLKDRLFLLDFFSTLEVELGWHGVKQQAEDTFETLRAMATIVEAQAPQDVADEICILCRDVGLGYGQAAAMFLLRKAGHLDRRQLQVWERALKSSLEEELFISTAQARVKCDLTPLSNPKAEADRDDFDADGETLVRENIERRDDFACCRNEKGGVADSDRDSRHSDRGASMIGHDLMKDFGDGVEDAFGAADKAMRSAKTKLEHAAEDVVVSAKSTFRSSWNAVEDFVTLSAVVLNLRSSE